MKVRQPLAMAVLAPRNEQERAALARLAEQVADELNVKRVETAAEAVGQVRYTLRPNLPVLGPRLGKDVGRVRAALQQADASEVVAKMRAGQPVTLDGFELSAGDIVVDVAPAAGWAAAEESGYLVLVDTRLTPELEAEGLARDLVRRLQDLRRQAGLEVTDRIHARFDGDGTIVRVLAEHGEYVAGETLALSVEAGATEGEGWTAVDADLDGHAVRLSLRKA